MIGGSAAALLLPPADLASRRPAFDRLPAGTTLHRIHTAMAADGSYGVLYTAKNRQGAFAESFLRRPGLTVLPTDMVGRKAYARLRTTTPLQFIRFYGPGQPRLGATSEITSGPLPYSAPQAWSKALAQAFPEAAGIAYKARHDNIETCYAIFERAAAAIVVGDQVSDLLAEPWFAGLLTRYDVGLL